MGSWIYRDWRNINSTFGQIYTNVSRGNEASFNAIHLPLATIPFSIDNIDESQVVREPKINADELFGLLLNASMKGIGRGTLVSYLDGANMHNTSAAKRFNIQTMRHFMTIFSKSLYGHPLVREAFSNRISVLERNSNINSSLTRRVVKLFESALTDLVEQFDLQNIYFKHGEAVPSLEHSIVAYQGLEDGMATLGRVAYPLSLDVKSHFTPTGGDPHVPLGQVYMFYLVGLNKGLNRV